MVAPYVQPRHVSVNKSGCDVEITLRSAAAEDALAGLKDRK